MFAVVLAIAGAATSPTVAGASTPGEGLFDCSVQASGAIEMHTRTATDPYKSSYCEFRDTQNEIVSCAGASVAPGCNKCTLSSKFSCTCSCTCPGTPGSNKTCDWKWSGMATFQPIPNALSCSCNGEHPPIPVKCNATLDIVVVLDGSASITGGDWTTCLGFTNTLVNSFKLGPTAVEIGVVQFSDDADVVIGLSSDAAAINTAVQNLQQMQGSTNTYQGFLKAKGLLDASTRKSAERVVILLTDGDQTSGRDAKGEADDLKGDGATIFGIGVGPNIHKSELASWVTLPASQHYFQVNDWPSLHKILEQLVKAACPPP